MKIVMVLTSHDQLGNTGRPTGFRLEEFVAHIVRTISKGAINELGTSRTEEL
jgi:hypothetical protein